MIRVVVPATTANLGPGFDCLGIALSLYDSFHVEEADGLFIEGCEPEFSGEDNLFVKAYRRGLEELGVPFRGLRVRFSADIPVARGLGSSSACIVGGLLAAGASAAGGVACEGGTVGESAGFIPAADPACNNAPDGRSFPKTRGGSLRIGFDRQRLLDLAAEIEGHPDNVVPAILGGFAVSVVDNGRVRTIASEVDDKLVFNALIPPFRLETEKARAVLPETLSLKDAVFNIGRAALTAAAFISRDYGVLASACSDRVHESLRAALIPGYEAVASAAREAGALALWLSGAGPTIMALTRGSAEDFAERIALSLSARNEGPWHHLSLSTDLRGARIESA